MATLLEPKKIRLSVTEAAAALSAAFRKLEGRAPSRGELAILLGQTGIETGGWLLPNYNWGGVKLHKGAPAQQMLKTHEYTPEGQKYYITVPFSAYYTAEQGALDYLKVLKRRKRWWSALKTGDLDDYVAALKQPPAYMTASASSYLAGMKRYINPTAVEQFARKSAVPAAIATIVLGVLSGVAYNKIRERR